MDEATPAWLWIALTLFAVIMQTVRTAGQKQLSVVLLPMTVTLMRFVFGLPFAIAYLASVIWWFEVALPVWNATFVAYALIASLAQIVATALLIHLFALRNFAVGTAYARTEAFLTALVGATIFGEYISAGGWLAITISVTGVLALTIARSDIQGAAWWSRLWNRAAGVGLASGLAFAVASLSIRKASLSFGDGNFLLTAGVTLVTMVTVQTVICGAWVMARHTSELAVMCRQWRLGTFVGLTSALGSIGWFTAMTVERAAYVKSLGQIEFLFALGISTLFFGERSNWLELTGMGLIAIGILVLVVAG